MGRKQPHPWEEEEAKTGRLFVYASELKSDPDAEDAEEEDSETD